MPYVLPGFQYCCGLESCRSAVRLSLLTQRCLIVPQKSAYMLLYSMGVFRGGRGGRGPPPIAEEIFALFKYRQPNIEKETSELYQIAPKALFWGVWCNAAVLHVVMMMISLLVISKNFLGGAQPPPQTPLPAGTAELKKVCPNTWDMHQNVPFQD